LEKRVLREVFGNKREGDWRKFHSEELHDLCSSSNTRVIKSRRVRWARHVAHIGWKRHGMDGFRGET